MKFMRLFIIAIFLMFVVPQIGFPLFVIVIVINIIKESKKVSTRSVNVNNNTSANNSVGNSIILKCVKCDGILQESDEYCGNCGAKIEGDNIKVEEGNSTSNPNKQYMYPSHFDKMYSLKEDEMLIEFLNRELTKANLDKDSKLIPSSVLKRKTIFDIILSALTFISISSIFFHFPLITYIIEALILFILFITTRGYNLTSYLIKQIKSRPSEKISNIVMSTKETLVKNTRLKTYLIGTILAVVLPLIIFINPIIIYEKLDNGYAVRYYLFGLTNYTKVVIPDTHNNKKVVSLRGNAFSNMPFLKEVYLSDNIVEIRGQAFKNAKKLEYVKLPSKLKYLGGSAFYNCTSLKNIEIPNTVTEIGGAVFYNATSLTEIEIPDSVESLGGEAFYNATSLNKITLSKNLKEIRGKTFENCTSLEEIYIPNSVTRIGGSAFSNCTNLKTINIPNSVTEIDGGAFYNAYSLTEIYIPDSVQALGGESFYNATSLKSVRLSQNLTEIRGNTFENCYSLEKITIPDKVTRIGGSAFRNNSSLREVNISRNSKLNEIGSSAFRNCYDLREIYVPYNTYINERAFKDSGTNINFYTR